jgi:outer membrane protein
MSKVFQEFHKTKSAAEKYKGNYEKAAQEMQERQTVYKNLATEARSSRKSPRIPSSRPSSATSTPPNSVRR